MRIIAILAVILAFLARQKGTLGSSGNTRSANSRNEQAENSRNGLLSSHTLNIKWHPDEYKYQRRVDTFKWTKDLPIWLGAVFAFLAFIISVYALKEARITTRQVTAQANAAIEANRPWIVVEGAEVASFDVRRNEVVVGILLNIKNVGRAPAQKINAHFDVKIRGGFEDTSTDMTKVCESKVAAYQGPVAFPEQGFPIRVSRDRSIEDIDATQDKIHAFKMRIFGEGVSKEAAEINSKNEKYFRHKIEFSLIGCVDYTDQLQIRRSTSFSLVLVRKPGTASTFQGFSSIDVKGDFIDLDLARSYETSDMLIAIDRYMATYAD